MESGKFLVPTLRRAWERKAKGIRNGERRTENGERRMRNSGAVLNSPFSVPHFFALGHSRHCHVFRQACFPHSGFALDACHRNVISPSATWGSGSKSRRSDAG